MAMALGGGSGQRADINVTPLIDVLLVLIIIFMVILPPNSTGLPVEAPQPAPADAQAVAESHDIVVSVNRDRTLAINSEAVRPEDLQDRLRVIFARRAQRVLFVRGHHELAFEDIVKVIDLAKGAGIYQVGLMTEYGEL